MKLKTIEIPLEVKADDAGQIEGHGAVFGNVDLGGDVIQKGAFGPSLIERKARGDSTMPMLWQHDPKQPVGVWTDFSEDDVGLALKGEVMIETAMGRDAHAFLRKRAIKGLSIGYVTKDADYDRKTGVRTIKAADVLEVSLVTFPMNPRASVEAVKSVDEIDAMSLSDIEQLMREAWDAPRPEVKRVINRLKHLFGQREAERAEAAELAAALERLRAKMS